MEWNVSLSGALNSTAGKMVVLAGSAYAMYQGLRGATARRQARPEDDTAGTNNAKIVGDVAQAALGGGALFLAAYEAKQGGCQSLKVALAATAVVAAKKGYKQLPGCKPA